MPSETYKGKTPMSPPEKIGFVLSTGRTGTKTLAEGLSGDGIASPHQPRYSRLLTVASNYYLHGWLPRRALEWLVVRIRGNQLGRANCHWYIQVFSLDHLPAKIISERYPNVYIVHIVRDPRTFVPSYINWTHTRSKSYIANKFVYGWHPSGFFTGHYCWRTWRRMNELQRVCWHWTYKNQHLEDLFSGYPRYLRIRFEDLFSSEDGSTMQKLCRFLSIPDEERFQVLFRERKNVNNRRVCPPWDAWQRESRDELLEICGGKMHDYGYV